MAALTVTRNTDYRGGPAETDITEIRFQGTGITAIFDPAQFGTGLISPTVVISATGSSRIDIITDPNIPMSFSAAGWTFGGSYTPQIWMTGSVADDTIVGSTRGDHIEGGAGNDWLTSPARSSSIYSDWFDGGDGNDTITGSSPGSTFIGGAGDDTFIETFGGSVYGDGGTDTIYTSQSQDLNTGYGVEVLILTGSASIYGYGDEIDNVIIGNDGNNTLRGGAGADRLEGGPGNDRLSAHSTNASAHDADTLIGGIGDDIYEVYYDLNYVTIVELPGEGSKDTIVANGGISLIAFSEIENATLLRDWLGNGNAVEGIGNAKGNRITAASIEDDVRLSGRGGADTLIGSGGDDTLKGEAGSDILLGGRGDDLLRGDIHNDTLDGGTGDDTLIGGAGDDLYYQREGVVAHIVELAGEGFDTIDTDASISLADLGNIEGVILARPDDEDEEDNDLDATGNASANALTGNEGDNELAGLDGNDTLTGGGGNDMLTGGAGADSMAGGTGDDTYVDPVLSGVGADVIVEIAGEGVDVVRSATTISLATVQAIENLVLTGTAKINGTGNANANTLTGNGAANRLNAGDGNDTLIASGGRDTLLGGDGDDVYIYDANMRNDVIIENADRGFDVIRTSESLALFQQGIANIERIEIVSNDDIRATGWDGAEYIRGHIGNNRLNGAGGNDTLWGGAGEDILIGNTGDDLMTGGINADTFRFALAGTGNDVIDDFATAEDRFDLTGGSFTSVVEAGGGTTLTHSGGTILIQGVSGLTLDQWNALVLPSGGSASADAPLLRTAEASYRFCPADIGALLAAVTLPEFAAFIHPDFSFA